MPLDRLQQDFSASLLDPERAVPDGAVDPDGRPAPKRFAVYRNNVTVSLMEAMATAFPTVRKIVGDEFFDAMARLYVRRYPPEHPVLIFYGKDFPAFLAAFEPTQHLAYLPDVARLELLRRESYHASDANPMAPECLANIAQDDLPRALFHFHPAARILTSPCPVFSIWEWNNEADEANRKPIPGHGEDCLITRPELTVEMRRLPPGAAGFITDLMLGRTLGEAAAGQADNSDFDLTANLAGLLESRALISLSIRGKDDDQHSP